jgi:hypothetical protein
MSIAPAAVPEVTVPSTGLNSAGTKHKETFHKCSLLDLIGLSGAKWRPRPELAASLLNALGRPHAPRKKRVEKNSFLP